MVLGTGAKVGIAIGAVLLVSILVLGAWRWQCARSRKSPYTLSTDLHHQARDLSTGEPNPGTAPASGLQHGNTGSGSGTARILVAPARASARVGEDRSGAVHPMDVETGPRATGAVAY